MLPADLRPMLATPGALPVGDEWAYEVKWDGFRALAFVESGRLVLRSRRGLDVTADYPGVRLDVPDAVLDGELVAMVDGIPSFNALQTRRVPISFVPFDVLHLRDRSLLDLRYDERRAVLLDLVPDAPPSFDDGPALMETTKAQGLEGVMAKRRSSHYHPGRRCPEWVKAKHVRRTSAVVGGWRPGEGGRAGRIGSLLLGIPSAEGLRYAGKVGTGFSDRTLAMLHDLLAPLERTAPPFVDPPRGPARWVEPRVVVDVDFTEWTADGRLRHPTYRGVREDVDPAEVVRE